MYLQKKVSLISIKPVNFKLSLTEDETNINVEQTFYGTYSMTS